MKILVLNCGSSSIKFQLINMISKEVIIKGIVERIGLNDARLKYSTDGRKEEISAVIGNHVTGIQMIMKYLIDIEAVVKDKGDIFAVGHRVVHAGEKYAGTVMITEDVLAALKECIPLAPLHNPANISGIEAAQKILPGVPMAGAFDTAFHQTMPEKAYYYPLPLQLYEKHGIRKYGFHGTSHFFVAKEAARHLDRKLEELRIITCHLGNGSSITAVDHGVSVDTSMGFTPLEGLMMGTRCGDIDPYIPIFLQKAENLGPEEVNSLLNKKSGIQGVSQISSDMRDLEIKADQGNRLAILSREMFAYRIKKYIGAYLAAMNGADVIVFTGGIGERDRNIRRQILQDLDNLGIFLDETANQKAFGEFGLLSTSQSPVKLMCIPTNEELEIAEQTRNIIEKNAPPTKG